MSERKYPKVRDNRWIQPIAKGYHMACCDCGLVHRMDFRIVGPRKPTVQFRVERAVGETKKLRTRMGVVVR